MECAITLQDEVLSYFTDKLEFKRNISVTIQEISNYEHRLLKIVLEQGFSATTETIESLLEELKKGAK